MTREEQLRVFEHCRPFALSMARRAYPLCSVRRLEGADLLQAALSALWEYITKNYDPSRCPIAWAGARFYVAKGIRMAVNDGRMIRVPRWISDQKELGASLKDSYLIEDYWKTVYGADGDVWNWEEDTLVADDGNMEGKIQKEENLSILYELADRSNVERSAIDLLLYMKEYEVSKKEMADGLGISPTSFGEKVEKVMRRLSQVASGRRLSRVLSPLGISSRLRAPIYQSEPARRVSPEP